jgi:hypothetical protein
MESQILALKKAIALVFQIPIGTSNANCYFKYQFLVQIPIVTSNTNRVTIHQEEEEEEQQQSGYKSRASTTCSRLKIGP